MDNSWGSRYDIIINLVHTILLAVPSTFWAKFAFLESSHNFPVQKAFWTDFNMLGTDWTNSLSSEISNASYSPTRRTLYGMIKAVLIVTPVTTNLRLFTTNGTRFCQLYRPKMKPN